MTASELNGHGTGGNIMENDARNIVWRFRHDRQGAVAIEYALIAVLIAVAIVGAVTALGGNVSNLFNLVVSQI